MHGHSILSIDREVKLLSQGFLPPTEVSFTRFKNKDVTYMNKSLDVIFHHLDKLQNPQNISWIDIIAAGDHGQGVLRFPVKIIFFYNDGNYTAIDSLIAKVECKKEEFHLLQQVVAPFLVVFC